jgi:hypothetical protein
VNQTKSHSLDLIRFYFVLRTSRKPNSSPVQINHSLVRSARLSGAGRGLIDFITTSAPWTRVDLA